MILVMRYHPPTYLVNFILYIDGMSEMLSKAEHINWYEEEEENSIGEGNVESYFTDLTANNYTLNPPMPTPEYIPEDYMPNTEMK